MPLPVQIVGSGATAYKAKVTRNGELVVGPDSPNISIHWSMTEINVAYNFASPVANQVMRLQNILIYGNKGIGTNDATVVIYTADSATATTGTTILELELPKYASRDLIGLNLELPKGVFLNAKINDNTVFLTMMGYYLPA